MLAEPMENGHRELIETLEAHYLGNGWRVERVDDGTLHASGPGGVTWIGAAITATDIEDENAAERLRAMAERRMEAGGELCPLELLPSPDCEHELRELLDRIGIGDRSNVEVYSLAS
jgi:hypothetical protein